MTGRRLGRLLAWTGIGLAVAVAAGLCAYFAMVGLDEADKLASAISVFIGLAGLVMSVCGVVLARRAPAPPAPSEAPPGGSSVTGSIIGGGVHQIRNVSGDLRLTSRGVAPSPSSSPSSPPSPPPPGRRSGDVATGNQSVTDSYVVGDVTQVDGVGGNTDIER